MFIENLVQLGFTQKESEVYLMLLRIGPSPVGSLSNRVGMKRVTVYSVLDSLITRGMVTVEHDGKCRRYIPHDPDCLLYFLEKQNAELKFRMNLAKTCIDGLNRVSFDGFDDGHKIALYRGRDTILETLSKRVNRQKTLFAIFLSFSGAGKSADCLHKFLLDDGAVKFQDCHLAVPVGRFEVAARVFKDLSLYAADFSKSSINADLLVQANTVFFIVSNKDDLQMIVFHDKTYAHFFREILLAPYFTKDIHA